MASDQFQGVERKRFPALLALGVLLGLVVIAVAFAVDSEIGWPLLVLLAICVLAAVGFRLIAGGHRDEADSSDSVVRRPATTDRPLGDTPEAHDELSPHDIPKDAPERHAAEHQAGGEGGTTRGDV
jgi:hypothetical protein